MESNEKFATYKEFGKMLREVAAKKWAKEVEKRKGR